MNVHLGYKYGDMSKVSTGDVTYRVTETRDMSPVTIVNEALRCVIITSRQLLTPWKLLIADDVVQSVHYVYCSN